jgi:SAM-dependent methyltransferase
LARNRRPPAKAQRLIARPPGGRREASPREAEGHEGWDEYAPFYDWENARTLGRRDVPFWRTVALNTGGTMLELGAGTGRISIPLGRAGVPVVGIDRSEPMLARARQRVKRAKLGRRVRLVRGDIRFLPFEDALLSRASSSRRSPKGGAGRGFSMVLAPYGMLQSLLRERDLQATLASVHRVLKKGGTFGVELVADLPSWQEYEKRVSLRGWRRAPGGAHVTLTETVRQDRKKGLTIFDQEFTERRGRKTQSRTFSLAFRTLSVPQMVRRLEKAGFEITALLGDYRGREWDPRADVWVILARKA